MDILLNGANAALHLAHDLRRDVEVGLLLLGPPHLPRRPRHRTRPASASDRPRYRHPSDRARSKASLTRAALAPLRRRASGWRSVPFFSRAAKARLETTVRSGPRAVFARSGLRLSRGGLSL